jgi:ubiquinone/menaquinone biosynthesis C-methylase UbiE
MKRNDDTTSEEKGTISAEMAKLYEEFFVPALLAELAEVMAKEAGVEKGNRVLDVACGTGIVARYMKEKLNADVSGVDKNREMLAVAAQKNEEIQWIESDAESLPFESNVFDAVTCQFALMFFGDKIKALQEMKRVLKPGRKAALAVWDKIESSPGYLALYNLIHSQFGEGMAGELLPPFALGDKESLKKIFTEAGFNQVEIKTKEATAKFPSIQSWIHAEVRGWVFSGMVNDAQLNELTRKAEKDFSDYTDAEGKVRFHVQVHVITVIKD